MKHFSVFETDNCVIWTIGDVVQFGVIGAALLAAAVIFVVFLIREFFRQRAIRRIGSRR